MIGRTIAHYKIVELIGSGGMGSVYRARDTKLDRNIALKVLSPDSARDRECRQRFDREAKAVAALKHPNIITIYSVEEFEGIHFLTMELVDGQTLTEIISASGIPLDHFLEVAIPIANALSCAHKLGITHRDLKPANIMIDGEGRLKVLDFGLAKLCEQHRIDSEDTIPPPAQLTQPGAILGTIAYMSPEQVSGASVDARSDVFSLGIVFYELLSGLQPFHCENLVATMYSIVNDDPPRLPRLSEAVNDLIARCLKKSPGDRFTDASEICNALKKLTESDISHSSVDPAITPSEIQSAIDREEWRTARKFLTELQAQRPLTPEELDLFQMCMFWIGEKDEFIRALERAYAAFAKAGKNLCAARLATRLAGEYVEKCMSVVSSGWLRQADRLLGDEPESVERGYLLRQQMANALTACNLTRATDLNEKCSEIADHFQDLALQAVALHDKGQILVAGGDVEEGQALIDEAMARAMGGDVDSRTLGNLYCRTMGVCKTLADYSRAREWTEVAWRWCEHRDEVAYPGICRIHRAESMRQLGDWTRSEEAAQVAYDDFVKCGLEGHAGEASNELGELALIKGEYEEAENAFRKALEFGFDPVPGLPLLRLAQGNREAAQQVINRALNENPADRRRRAMLLAANIRITLAVGDLPAAEAAVDELTRISKEFGSPAFEAHASIGRGQLELEGGNPESAITTLREAWSSFNDMGLSYDAARTRVLLGKAYLKAGNKEDGGMQFTAARTTFGNLGAMTDLEAVSDLIERSA